MNRRVPTRSELRRWRARSNYRDRHNRFYTTRVTGRFRGTTEDILRWGALKWGLDEDVLRAQAVRESEWNQAAVGDGGLSFGILQLKSSKQRGTFPLSRDSTAFNVDYAGMVLRHCYDGQAVWLGRGYRAGDPWGCVGYYYSGNWYDAGSLRYMANVRNELKLRPWLSAGF